MIQKGWRMFSQNLRSKAHTPGLFKTLSIIRIYSKHWANIRIYSNLYFVMKTNTNIYLSTKILEYSNIRIFMLIPAHWCNSSHTNQLVECHPDTQFYKRTKQGSRSSAVCPVVLCDSLSAQLSLRRSCLYGIALGWHIKLLWLLVIGIVCVWTYTK